MVVVAVTIGAWLLLGVASGVIAAGTISELQDHQLGRSIGLGVVGSVAGGFVSLLLGGAQGGMRPWSWLASIIGAATVLAIASLVLARRRT